MPHDLPPFGSSSDESRVLEALTLLRESVRAVLAQTEEHPLDSLFAKYYVASPEFSELIVAWDGQSSKENKISLLMRSRIDRLFQMLRHYG